MTPLRTSGRSIVKLMTAFSLTATLAAGGDEPAAQAPEPSALKTTFVETVTVAATKSEREIKDTPGQVDVITAEQIETLGLTGPADLVLFAPGVFVEGDLTRLGTNGFNIRGIGGNRVLTQIDGIPTSEQFDFGPLSITQYSLDLDTLERVEIVRSAGSALYGSDALGGVVSLVTRSPRSYLGNELQHLGLRAGWDGRSGELSESVVYARGNDRWQGSLVYTHRDGEQLDNQGEVETESSTRTAPNPIDRRQDNALLKLAHTASEGSQLEVALEWLEGRAITEVLSGQVGAALDSDAVDRQERQRLSVEQSLVSPARFADSLLWRGYWQQADTEQVATELRTGALGVVSRVGLFSFDQETFGLDAEARKGFGAGAAQALTYGVQLQRDRFDGLRDRTENLVSNGAPVPQGLIFPTKYFPESTVDEIGLFVQGELNLAGGRVQLIPGLRFDRYDLDPSVDDAIFLAGNPGQPTPVAVVDEAVSPKLGAVVALSEEVSLFGQYARGFRAPPMSDVNNGFTNQAGGYRTLPNPDLQPETSDNFELGLRGSFARGSFSVTAFDNRYDDFIEIVTIGFNPTNFLIELQAQNVNEVEISGIELAGDVRFGKAWRLRGAYSVNDSENVTTGAPLLSVAPARLVTGLRYERPSARWGAEAIATVVEAKGADDVPAGSTQFRPPGYEIIDLAAWVTLTQNLSLQLSVWNLTDETYWQWTYVRGQVQTSPVLDRYTSPGRSFGAQIRARF